MFDLLGQNIRAVGIRAVGIHDARISEIWLRSVDFR